MLSMTLKQLMTFAYDVESYRISASELPNEPYDVIAKIPGDAVNLPEDARWQQVHLMAQALLADRFKLAVHRDSEEMSVYRLTAAKGGLKLRELGPNRGDNVVVQRAPGHLSAEQMPMSQLVSISRGELKRPVIDEAGVKGVFNVALDWAPAARNAQRASEDADSRPSLFTAVEERLGLKLISGKSTIEVIVVDHAERASEN